MRRRHGRQPGEPGEDLLVGKLHQPLEKAKLTLVEAREPRIRECAQQQIHFANAAVPSAKSQPPPANLGIGKHEFWRLFGCSIAVCPAAPTLSI